MTDALMSFASELYTDQECVKDGGRYAILHEKCGLLTERYDTIASAMAACAEQMRNAMVCDAPFGAEVWDCLRPNHPRVVVIMGDFCGALTSH